MQSYDDFWLVPTKKMIAHQEAYGTYTEFATNTANPAITVAKHMKKGKGIIRKKASHQMEGSHFLSKCPQRRGVIQITQPSSRSAR